LGESHSALPALRPVNRSSLECPRLLGFREVRRGGRDCQIDGEWRWKRTWDPTFSGFCLFVVRPLERVEGHTSPYPSIVARDLALAGTRSDMLSCKASAPDCVHRPGHLPRARPTRASRIMAMHASVPIAPVSTVTSYSQNVWTMSASPRARPATRSPQARSRASRMPSGQVTPIAKTSSPAVERQKLSYMARPCSTWSKMTVAAVDQRTHRGRHRLYKAAEHRPETRHDGRRRSWRRYRHHLDTQRRERIVFSLPTGIGAAVGAWRGHQDEVVEARDEIGKRNRRLQGAGKAWSSPHLTGR